MACCRYPLTEPVKKGDGVMQYKIAIIADLDKLSKGLDKKGHSIWHSSIVTGSLTYDETKKEVNIEMASDDKPTTVTSGFSRGMRGMELSELIVFNGNTYSVDDRTGIVFDVGQGKAIPWVILADGDGKQPSGFKGEWMTKKSGKLYVGGHGVERMSIDGKSVIHRNYQWVKRISDDGAVEHVNWESNYNALRNAVECPAPGYLTHESAAWSDVHQQWFFLPRKVSKEVFHPKKDEERAGNILMRCSDDFTNITQQTIGELRPTRGYSSFKFIPGTDDKVILAIKSEEIGDAQKAYAQVFTVDGKVLLDDFYLNDMKYEGVEFI